MIDPKEWLMKANEMLGATINSIDPDNIQYIELIEKFQDADYARKSEIVAELDLIIKAFQEYKVLYAIYLAKETDHFD